MRTIGFTIALRLMSGRMDEASIGVELLLADDKNKAYEIASEIRLKYRRKVLVEKYTKAKSQVNVDNEINIVAGEDWHGCSGIVASKLVDAYGKPAIVRLAFRRL